MGESLKRSVSTKQAGTERRGICYASPRSRIRISRLDFQAGFRQQRNVSGSWELSGTRNQDICET